MEYKKLGETYYIRMDRGDRVVSGIMDICRKEGIKSAIYTGIGGCSDAQIQTFIPERGEFETEDVHRMLELVALTGNVVSDEGGTLFHHSHAMFAYKDKDGHQSIGGHLKETIVLYTAEIELRPTVGGYIGRKYNDETGTGFWDFKG